MKKLYSQVALLACCLAILTGCYNISIVRKPPKVKPVTTSRVEMTEYTLFADFEGSKVSTTSATALNTLCTSLTQNPAVKYLIRLEGHSTAPKNMAATTAYRVGMARANQIKKLLIAQGLQEIAISISSSPEESQPSHTQCVKIFIDLIQLRTITQ